MIVAAGIAVLPFLLPSYYTAFLANVIVLGLFALSLYVSWSLAGVLSFCQAVFFGVGAYSAAYASVKYEGLAAELLYPVLGLALACALAALIAFVASAGRLQELMFAIVTLVVAVLAQIVLTAGGDATGGSQGFFGIPALQLPGINSAASAVWFGGAIAIVLVLLVRWLVRSRFGLAFSAVRDNELRARACGYRAGFVKGLAFVLGAAVACLAGYLYARQNGYASPDLAGFALSANVIIYLVLGGRYSIWGAFIGALLVEGFRLELAGTAPEIASLITAAVFIPIVVLFPGGAAGMLDGLRRRLAGAPLLRKRVRALGRKAA